MEPFDFSLVLTAMVDRMRKIHFNIEKRLQSVALAPVAAGAMHR